MNRMQHQPGRWDGTALVLFGGCSGILLGLAAEGNIDVLVGVLAAVATGATGVCAVVCRVASRVRHRVRMRRALSTFERVNGLDRVRDEGSL